MAALQGPGFDRLWTEARRAWQRRGTSDDARVVVRDLTLEEVSAIDGLLGDGPPLVVGRALRRPLSHLERALEERGLALLEVLAEHDGPVPDVRAERRAARAARVELLDSLAELIDVVNRPELHTWLQSARLAPDDEPRARLAVTIVGRLPQTPAVSRAVLAARLCAGDSHALDSGSALEALVRRMLQVVDGCPGADLGTLEARRLWERFGVEPDPTSSTVLSLGLPGDDRSACGRVLAASSGHHAVLSYGSLRDDPPVWEPDLDVFVCENPAVLHEAERELGRGCAPLVCTSGWPGSAAQLLLASLAASGARLWHHADFDGEGVAMHEHLATRYGARPWRFSSEDYLDAVERSAIELPRLRATTEVGPMWDAFRQAGVQVVEELVLAALLADLRR